VLAFSTVIVVRLAFEAFDLMRVLVVGAGVIGSIHGWALAESGHQVIHLVRSGRAATLRDGMRLDICDRRKRAGWECLQVVRRRGVDLSRYAETRPFLTNSALLRRVYIWTTRRMFWHDEYTKRCSAHALGDRVEVRTFYDDLIASGHNFGVSMPVMQSYAEDIRRFAITA